MSSKKSPPLHELCIVCKLKYKAYGKPGEKKTHCGGCKEQGMVLTTARKCVVCKTKQPTFAAQGEKKTTHCGDCKTQNMVNVKHAKCEVCKERRPNYGAVWGKPTHCSTCKPEGMSNAVTSLCVKCEEIQPTYGTPGTKTATHCKKCKSDYMIDLKSRMCSVCDKIQPTYAVPQSKTPTHCFGCKKEGMINVKHRKCSVCNKKRPNYGPEGSKRPTHCVSCKDPSMIDLVHTMCKTPLCMTRADQSVYEGYCLRCAVHNGIEVKRNYKTREKAVVDSVKAEYSEMEWKMDKIIEGACSKRRGDMHVDLGYLYLIVEIDEHQHRGYMESCDKRRYHDIAHDVYSSSGERPIVFLRFNPDEYIDKSGSLISTPWCRLKTGLWSISKDRVIEFIDRTDILTSRINYYLDEDNIPSAPITVETMFYNGHDPSNPIATLAIEGRI